MWLPTRQSAAARGRRQAAALNGRHQLSEVVVGVRGLGWAGSAWAGMRRPGRGVQRFSNVPSTQLNATAAMTMTIIAFRTLRKHTVHRAMQHRAWIPCHSEARAARITRPPAGFRVRSGQG